MVTKVQRIEMEMILITKHQVVELQQSTLNQMMSLKMTKIMKMEMRSQILVTMLVIIIVKTQEGLVVCTSQMLDWETKTETTQFLKY